MAKEAELAVLSDDEQRQLGQIERHLEAEDPALVERIRQARMDCSPDGRLWPVSDVMTAATAMVVLGLLINPALVLGVAGIVVSVFWIRRAARWAAGDTVDPVDPGREPI